MKYGNILLAAALLIPTVASAQSAVDAYRFAQPDLKGTARFMSMGGAFGALGADLSCLSQNPGGIGVYRSSDIGFTLDLDVQHNVGESQGSKTALNNTYFYLNNIGAVWTVKLGSSSVPNLNFGFTYNKNTSFNRSYGGYIPQLSNSMSNYMAGVANENGLTVGDLTPGAGYDPYNPTDGGVQAPWIDILAYQSYLIYPYNDQDNPQWEGQWGNGTSGSGFFNVEERGCVDSYNLALGGNIANVVYWGMDFDITSLHYSLNSTWGEKLDDAYVNLNGEPEPTSSDWSLVNHYAVSCTGFNYKLGFIVKPIQELRLGFAFHTPTWYSLSEAFQSNTKFRYAGVRDYDYEYTNDNFPGYNSMNFSSPWRIIASAAGVIGGKFIISADYEWAQYSAMKFSTPNTYYDYGYDWDYDYWDGYSGYNYVNDPYGATNQDIKKYYKDTNTLRIGAEYRVSPQFSVRAGYSFVSSPVTLSAKEGNQVIYTAGTMPEYRFDNTTNYITCGLGYKIQKFYVDLAYVYKNMSSTFHAYTSDPDYPQIKSPTSSLGFNSHQVVLSAGFKF